MDDFLALCIGLGVAYILGVYAPTFDPKPYVQAHLDYRHGR